MTSVFTIALLIGVCCPVWSQEPGVATQHEMHVLHRDTKAYIAALEDPSRDVYQKPTEVLSALNLRKGDVVADIGSGSGYFAVRLAPLVGESGRILAVDVSPEMVVYLNRRIRDSGLKNVQTILAAPDDPLLSDGSVDLFFVCNTWHHIENRDPYLRLMKKALKPGGRVVMVDFQKRDLPVGPPLGMKIAREDLLRQMDTGGFRVLSEHTFLPYQYFLVFGPR